MAMRLPMGRRLGTRALFPPLRTKRLRRIATLRDGIRSHLCQVTLLSRWGARILTSYEPDRAVMLELVLEPQLSCLCVLQAIASPWLDLAFISAVDVNDVSGKRSGDARSGIRYASRRRQWLMLQVRGGGYWVQLGDISRDGARLDHFPDLDDLDRVTLVFGTGVVRQARICWRLAGSAGVEFIQELEMEQLFEIVAGLPPR
jgi:hypothetical protein